MNAHVHVVIVWLQRRNLAAQISKSNGTERAIDRTESSFLNIKVGITVTSVGQHTRLRLSGVCTPSAPGPPATA
jgi:hypothetical protein